MRLRLGIRRRAIGVPMKLVLGPITHVSTRQPVAALTFDDGPHPESTLRLLGILEKHRAHATFFMVGSAARKFPELVRRVAMEGHAVGNHSWDHPSFPLISGHQRRAQILACAKVLAPYGQSLFRPPYGHLSVTSRLDVLWLRHEVIGWNGNAEDWLDHDADWMADRLTAAVRPGSIIVLHDALYHVLDQRYADRGPMLEAVDKLLSRLGSTFRFVTIPDLLRLGRPQRRSQWFGRVDVQYLNSLDAAVGEPRQYPQWDLRAGQSESS